MRGFIAVLATLAFTLMAAAPASAKGASGLEVVWQGEATEVEVTWETSGDMVRLTDAVVVYHLVFGDEHVIGDPPSGRLGPAVVLRWRYPKFASQTEFSTIRQYLWPWAEQGPVTYLPPGQPFLAEDFTTGGWARASNRALDRFEAVGLSIDYPRIAEPSGSYGDGSITRTGRSTPTMWDVSSVPTPL